MNRPDPHPLELLLLGAWLAVEAACHLLAALVALMLVLIPRTSKNNAPQRGALKAAAQTGDATAPQQVEPISPERGMPPAPHPLAVLAEQLVADCTRRQLQALAGTRANLSKAQLAGMVAACS